MQENHNSSITHPNTGEILKKAILFMMISLVLLISACASKSATMGNLDSTAITIATEVVATPVDVELTTS